VPEALCWTSSGGKISTSGEWKECCCIRATFCNAEPAEVQPIRIKGWAVGGGGGGAGLATERSGVRSNSV
jgi:hypothetical protein